MRTVTHRITLLVGAAVVLLALSACASQPAAPPTAAPAKAAPAATQAAPAPAATAAAPAKTSSGAQSAAVDFPTKPITIISWSAAGSKVDVASRKIGAVLSKVMGVPVVIQDKEGGGGVVGINDLLAQPADGYTMALVSPTLASLFTQPGVTFKMADILPIEFVQYNPFLVVVPANSPYKTLKDLLDYMKANPGKIKIGGPFAIGNHRVQWEEFAQVAKVQATWIPFDGSGQATTAIAGAQLDAITSTDPGAIKQLVTQGKVRVLAISSDQRLPGWEDVPTYKEAGVPFTHMMWQGLVAKTGVPQPVVDKLIAGIRKAVQDPDWQTYLKNENGVDASGTSQADQQKIMDDEATVTAELVKKLGQ